MGVLIGDPAWRGRGATTEVLDASIAWLACRRGIREVVLGVERDHRAAIRAYEKAGFRIETTDRINVDPRSQLAMVRYI
jgi:RimJ/RimL family protein N-acetyltransferase